MDLYRPTTPTTLNLSVSLSLGLACPAQSSSTNMKPFITIRIGLVFVKVEYGVEFRRRFLWQFFGS